MSARPVDRLRSEKRLAAAATCLLACWAAKAGDLDSLLRTPFPAQLVSAAHSERLAWIANERGVRNVWSAVPPRFVPQRVTAGTEDDGQELGALTISRDGSTLVWVRGGHPDPAGFSQNPQSLPGGVEQQIWIATGDQAPRMLVQGDSPVLSPDGRVLIFSQGQMLRCVSATGAPAPGWCTSPLLKLRGDNGRSIFSPDGHRLAFVSDRKDHSFVGVLDTASRSVTWMAPDVSRDDFPVWSPDGTHVAFLRISGATFGETLDITGAWPFEIWIADAATGVGKRLFHSSDTAGGFAQMDNEGPPREPLRWTATNDLLFYSEESGWLHLYALSPTGGQARDLTPGNCEVESDALAQDGKTLIVSSNCAAIDGRQLFRVPVAGGKSARLPGGSIDVEAVYLGASGAFAYRSADALHPISVVVARNDVERTSIFPFSSDTPPTRSLVTPEIVTFIAPDGLTIHGQLFRAPGKGRHPAILFAHGGPIRQMLPGWHYMEYYTNSYAMNQNLASRGFVVLAVNYRDGIGYGQTFRRAKNQGPRGASEYQDILAGRDYVAHLADVDPDRIGIYGGSYGGLLTAQALARNSNLFAAGVDLHGVHDWAQKARESSGAGWGIDPSLYELSYQSSPVADVGQWRSPVLFIHGDDDRSVPFNQTTDLVARLRARNVPVETLVFPDEEHGFLRYATWLRAYEAAADFLTRTLGATGDH